MLPLHHRALNTGRSSRQPWRRSSLPFPRHLTPGATSILVSSWQNPGWMQSLDASSEPVKRPPCPMNSSGVAISVAECGVPWLRLRERRYFEPALAWPCLPAGCFVLVIPAAHSSVGMAPDTSKVWAQEFAAATEDVKTQESFPSSDLLCSGTAVLVLCRKHRQHVRPASGEPSVGSSCRTRQ